MIEKHKPSQYECMVLEAIESMNDPQGSLPKDIIGYIKDHWNLESANKTIKANVNRALRQGINHDSIARTDSGLYTLATSVRRRSFRRRKPKRRGGKRRSKRKKSRKRKKRKSRRRKPKRSGSGSVSQIRKKRRRRKVKKSLSGSVSQIKRKGRRTRRRLRSDENPDSFGRRRKGTVDAEIRAKRQKKSTDTSS